MNYTNNFDKFLLANVFLVIVVALGEICSHCFSAAPGDSAYKSVDGLLFTKDGRTLVAVSAPYKNVTIPVYVTSIEERAFSCCSGLMSVTIPDSVTSVGRHAFYGTALETVYVSPGDAERIKDMFLDSGHDIKNVKFLEMKEDGSWAMVYKENTTCSQ